MKNSEFARAVARLLAVLAFAFQLTACGGGGGGNAGSSGSGDASRQGPPLISQALLSVTPDVLAFDSQPIGTSSGPYSVQVTNTGVGPSQPIRTSVSGSGSFRVKSSNCAKIAPNSSCTVTFDFTPQTLGSLTATATIGDGVVSTSVRLSGLSLTGPVACQTVSPRAASGLTLNEIAQRVGVFMPHIRQADDGVRPFAAPAGHTPGNYQATDIRQAYGLPGLPGASAEPASSYGAGQTIYIVNAGSSDANVLADLNAFSGAMGLPACTQRPPNVPMPVAGPTCSFTIVNSDDAGNMSATTPLVIQGWPTEMALDVEWAHAMAPLASIVLVQASDARTDHMLNAVSLANRMARNQGGVVSMSFGHPESSWDHGGSPIYAPYFSAANMTYLASTGDNGQAVEMPAGHPNVLAVGGTSLRMVYNPAGGAPLSRTEVVWGGDSPHGTGGGISRYAPIPFYQRGSVAIPGQPTTQCGSNFRATADASMIADPETGVPILQKGVWNYGIGGTSLSAPALAGILTVINAQRVAAGSPPLGEIHDFLYSTVYANRALYASAFNDIVTGNNAPPGGCRLFGKAPATAITAQDPTGATCMAGVGYDIPSGLGTPIFSGLATLLPGK